MTDEEVRALVNQHISHGGVQNIDNGQYWVDKYREYGSKDPAYFKTKLQAGIGDQPGYNGAFGNVRSTPFGGGGGGGGYGTGSFGQPPPTFTAPSGLDMSNDPGYLARMQMGSQAIQGAAAARGSLLGGGTLKALERYGQDYGSGEYGNVYGRALTGYTTNVNVQRGGQQDYWSRLQDLYRGGQAATGQTYQKP